MPRLLALLRELVRFSSAGVAPRKLLVCGTHLRNRRRAAHPHQPGEIARTHTAMRSRRRPPPARRAPFSRTQLHPASQAAHNHSVRRAVWRTNTHSGPCSWRANGTAATVRHTHGVLLRSGGTGAFLRDPACPQPHNCMAHPAPHTTSRDARIHPPGNGSHPCASLRVCSALAFRPPVHRTSVQPRRSCTTHCTAPALHCSLQFAHPACP